MLFYHSLQVSAFPQEVHSYLLPEAATHGDDSARAPISKEQSKTRFKKKM
jgi:hypothetical protein